MSSSVFALSKQERVTSALEKTTGQQLPFDFKSRLLVQSVKDCANPLARMQFQNAVGASVDTLQKAAPVDIYRGVRNGVFRFGIFGVDMLTETAGNVDVQQIAAENDLVIYTKPYPNECSFNLLYPTDDGRTRFDQLTSDDVVVTAYPETLRSIFENSARGNMPQILAVDSSVEGYVGMPSLDNPSRNVTVAFDLVETGNTARANGLRIGETLMETGLVIIARREDSDLMKKLGDAWGFVPYGAPPAINEPVYAVFDRIDVGVYDGGEMPLRQMAAEIR